MQWFFRVRRITICPVGRHANRQPFAYPSVLSRCEAWVSVTKSPHYADVLLLAHPGDIHEEASILSERKSSQRILILSEEPFWDCVWGADLELREQTFETAYGPVHATYLNHCNSEIFDFKEIPYYFLTDLRCFARYAIRFKRNSGKTLEDWKAEFEKHETFTAFIAERRTDPKFERKHESSNVFGLSVFRTRLAQHMANDNVVRKGRGWDKKGFRRQALPDWHLEKLLSFDSRCQFVSALENTHCDNYISEKFFDALAMGGIPIYYASPEHRIHGLSSGSCWINAWNKDEQAVAEIMKTFKIDEQFLGAYSACQKRFYTEYFSTLSAFAREYRRLISTLKHELEAVMSINDANLGIRFR